MNDLFGCIQVQPSYRERDAWSAAARKENWNYEVIEFSLPPVLSSGGWPPHILEWYTAGGRVTSLHGCFIDVNPASSDELFRQLSVQRMKESCALALKLGAGNIVFHAGSFPFLRGSYLDQWAGKTAEFLEELAAAYDLNFFVENSMDVDPDPVKALMQRISNPRIGVCLDVGHANYSRAPVGRWFEELGTWISYLHLSENMGKFDDHLPLGTGTIDWEEVSALWKALNREVPITLETGSLKHTLESAAFLREHHYFSQQ